MLAWLNNGTVGEETKTSPDSDHDGNFLNGSVWFRSDALTKVSNTKKYDTTGDFAEVYDTLVEEYSYLTTEEKSITEEEFTTVNDAAVWKYIINYANKRYSSSKDEIKVLMIEPQAGATFSDMDEEDGLMGYFDYHYSKDKNTCSYQTKEEVQKKLSQIIYNSIGDEDVKKITIDLVSIQEFIGQIEDLNDNYDIVMFSDNILNLNYRENNSSYLSIPWGSTNSSSLAIYDWSKDNVTYYYDNQMIGLIYSHVGDVIPLKAYMGGLLDGDYKNKYLQVSSARYEGNDLTLEKFNALLDYLDAGHPIIMPCRFWKDGSVNSELVDNSSYLYDLLSLKSENSSAYNTMSIDSGKYKDLIFTWDEVANYIVQDGNESNYKYNHTGTKASIFKSCVMNSALSLEPMDGEIDGNNFIVGTKNYVTGDITNSGVQVLSADSNGTYTMQFAFQIRLNGEVDKTTDYTVKLFLDANADGKFSPETEEIDETNITITTGNDEKVTNGKLKVDTTYTLSYEMAEEYKGCATWQLEVYQTNNKYVRTSTKGYLRLDTEGAVTINILQIHYNNSDYIDLGKELNSEGSYFGKYYNMIKDQYELNVTTWYSGYSSGATTGYATKYEDYARSYDETSGETYEQHMKHFLEKFDMLIIGFSNGLSTEPENAWGILGTDSDDKIPDSIDGAGGIVDFIKSGKSVLFAHDSTSFSNNKYGYRFQHLSDGNQDDWDWGYALNQTLRDLVGMDAYGVTLDSTDGESTMYANLHSGVGFEIANIKNSYLGELLIPEIRNSRYVYGTKDIAYKPNTNKTSTVGETQGFTYSIMTTRSTLGSGALYYKRWRKSSVIKGKKENGDNIYYYNTNNNSANNAVQINEGQITNYPFKISNVGDEIEIGTTHGQFYTLDMNADDDEDGETDIVVWYTLSGGTEVGSEYSGKWYDKYGKDVVSDYYLYSKANIIYTGMGHNAGREYGDEAYTEDEAKLFLNAMVSSYQSSLHPPVVTISNDTVYSYYSSDIQGTQTTYEDVYFTVVDSNLTQGGDKTYAIKCYVEVAGADGTTKTEEIKSLTDSSGIQLYRKTATGEELVVAKEGSSVKYNTDGTISGLSFDDEYFIRIPASVFQDSDSQEIMLAAQTTLYSTYSTGSDIYYQQTDWCTAERTDSVKYVNVELFDLD